MAEQADILDFGVASDPNVWLQYERMKRQLPIDLSSEDYQEEIEKICDLLKI